MASEVDICNLALGHLGDDATVSSINPPEGSIQAEHCARFYPVARDLCLEAHEWGFATRRATLAQLSITLPPEWLYAYQLPSNCRNPIKLRDPNAAPDTSFNDFHCGMPYDGRPFVQSWQETHDVPYELESLDDGTSVIYTNLAGAILQYVAGVTDTTKFSAQFVDSVGWLLAAYLAGPVIKGDAGASMANVCMKAYLASLSQAKVNDANNRRRSEAQSQRAAPWIMSR